MEGLGSLLVAEAWLRGGRQAAHLAALDTQALGEEVLVRMVPTADGKRTWRLTRASHASAASLDVDYGELRDAANASVLVRLSPLPPTRRPPAAGSIPPSHSETASQARPDLARADCDLLQSGRSPPSSSSPAGLTFCH